MELVRSRKVEVNMHIKKPASTPVHNWVGTAGQNCIDAHTATLFGGPRTQVIVSSPERHATVQ
ncbi:hypothetical protein THIX_20532 [Thiomonas sp. X19]|nr:hypothetical protein THIX_20532 [Thiomonas sp. X19]